MKTMEEGIEEKEEESLLIGRDFNARVGKKEMQMGRKKSKGQVSTKSLDSGLRDSR